MFETVEIKITCDECSDYGFAEIEVSQFGDYDTEEKVNDLFREDGWQCDGSEHICPKHRRVRKPALATATYSQTRKDGE